MLNRTQLRTTAVFLAVMLGACRGPETPGELASGCRAERTFPVETIADTASGWQSFVRKVESVQLDAVEDNPIGVITDIRKHPQGGYVVLDARVSRQAYLFDSAGALVASLGSTGKGPNEYQGVMDARIDDSGNIFLLSRAGRKVLRYGPTGNYLDEWSFADLGIAPDQFELLAPDGRTVAFYVLHPDFVGPGEGNKVIVATYDGQTFAYSASYAPQEPTGRRLFFSGGTFLRLDADRILVSPIFELGSTVFDIAEGSILATFESVAGHLPRPQITQELFKDHNRVFEALPVYSSVTRLYTQGRLGDAIYSAFITGSGKPNYLLFHDLCGRRIDAVVSAERFPLLYRVAGRDDVGQEFYVAEEAPESGVATDGEALGPRIDTYHLRQP